MRTGSLCSMLQPALQPSEALTRERRRC